MESRHRMLRRLAVSLAPLAATASLALSPPCLPADWPDFRGDRHHTGTTGQTLSTPLRLAWHYEAAHPPSPAFRGGLAPSRRGPRVEPTTYDYLCEPIIADGVAYFGAGLFPTLGTYLYAVESESGKLVWKRLVPYSPHGEIVVEGDALWAATG